MPLLYQTRHFMRQWVKAPLKRLARPGEAFGYEHELGMFILKLAEEFSLQRCGKPEALLADSVQQLILRQEHLSWLNEAHQCLQTALMPDYEQNLFEYYRQQQYLLLLSFLSYPFRGPGCLRAHVEPFRAASSKLSSIRVLDYGAGIPFGIIYLLRTCPEKMKSITLVDLDLVHAELTEFIIRRLAPQAETAFLKTTNAETIPDLGGRRFNLMYGKDVFEHVHDPERLLRTILTHAEPGESLGYFDITDHGEKSLQHVHPQLSHLSHLAGEYGFKPNGKVRSLTEFVRIK